MAIFNSFLLVYQRVTMSVLEVDQLTGPMLEPVGN